jgi:hypothetical protein
MEARSLLQDPTYREQARQQQSSIDQLFQDFQREQDEASQLASQRQDESQAIRDAAMAYLNQRRSGVESDVQGQIDQAQASQDNVRAALAAFQDTGDVQSLAAGGFDPSVFNTETAQRTQEASDLYDKIINQYANIAGTPTLDLGINPSGKETFVDESGKALATRGIGNQGLSQDEADLVRRERALREHFLPSRAFGDVLPLYFGGATKDEALFQQPDARPFVRAIGLERTPTMENVSTSEQRDIINRVNEIMGSLDRLDDVDPFQAATIAADMEGFLAEEERALNQKKDESMEGHKKWSEFVKGTRSKYRRMKRKAKWGQIASAAGIGGPDPLTLASMI